MGLFDTLKQALGAGSGAPQLDQVTQNAPADVLAKGLNAAFSSEKTPPIGNIVGQLFGNSNGAQQAGMLNQILATVGPGVAAGLGGGVLGKLLGPGQTQITPQQASELTPQEVENVVNHANDAHPGVADALAQFYAQHRGLVNTLGGIAATVALTRMKDHLES
ncbi:MAG TPA: hypothetical protein VF925_05265 [Casimicrobiaceae bacterium]